MSENQNFEKLLKDFFSEIFYEKCVIEDSSVTSEEQDSINSLTFIEVLENLKNLFMELMNFKKSFLTQDKFEILKTNEKFEAMLQKLEAEVRNHIRVEHQLKLHIENNQSHSEELEAINQKLIAQIKELGEGKGKGVGKVEVKGVMERIVRLEGIVGKKDTQIAKLEADNLRLRRMLDGKENGKRGDVEGFKQKCEENFSDLFKLEQVLKEKSTRGVMRERNRSNRKSNVETEISQIRAKEVNKASAKSLSKVHSRSTSEQVRPVSGLRKRV